MKAAYTFLHKCQEENSRAEALVQSPGDGVVYHLKQGLSTSMVQRWPDPLHGTALVNADPVNLWEL